jgi:site-specific DNA-cytosine methylase
LPYRTPREAIVDRSSDTVFEAFNTTTKRTSGMISSDYDPDMCGSLGTMTTKGFAKKINGKLVTLGHWEGRPFTIPELGYLAGFPPNYFDQYEGSYSDAVEGLGNAVPPIFQQIIAVGIRKHLSDWKSGRLLE